MLKPDHCRSCLGWSWGCGGYVPASGSGDNGVLVVAEAAGEHETSEGMPLVGKAGYYLWQNLQRVGIDREGFRCHNVLSCRPPDNKLSKMPYEEQVITHCSPLLDQTIFDMQKHCLQTGRTFVIITLGQIAFKRILGITAKDPILKEDYLAYPFWSDKYGAWVLPADHPSYLMRGNNHLLPILQFTFKRALEIAEQGLKLEDHNYLLDPAPETFAQWVEDYFRTGCEPLSYDIETPYKRGMGEDELSKDEDGDSTTILRIAFSYRPNEATSVRWDASYLPYIERLFSCAGDKVGWNSRLYDDSRVLNHIGEIKGDRHDAMLMWHVLNTALPKSLGSVTPYYVPRTGLWKHLSDSQPAFYNAKDADMALRCFYGIRKDLKSTDLWKVYDRHVVLLNRALGYMSSKGVQRDEVMRRDAETRLTELLDVTELKMEAAVPTEARKLKVYKKTPKDTNGMIQVKQIMPVKRCSICGTLNPKKVHFKITKKHDNVCDGGIVITTPEEVMLWAKPQEFKVSKVGLQKYQSILKHQAVLSRKEKKVTFDETAILKLIKQYPNDPLYPRILEHREYQKLLSTYIGITQADGLIHGGMPVGEDGRIRTVFSHNPSTLRLASQDPNLQNLPRPGGENDLQTIIRNLIIAGEGSTFTARDYSGIEAVLVGYFACDPTYIRLAKIDVHTFYTLYALYELDGRVASSDLPDPTWPDERLIPHLAHFKKVFKKERNSLYKHLVHGANFFQGAKGAQEKILKESGVEYPVSLIKKVMDIYFELFPAIRRWHHSLWAQTEKDGYIRNPFGYVHRFSKVYDYEKIGGRWQKSPGQDANKSVAFLPQSTAAGIIKEAILRLYFDRFDEAGQFLRLQVHDEIFAESPESRVDDVDLVMKEEMERPIREMALPASYGMGPYLIIDTEGKRGKRWGSMQ